MVSSLLGMLLIILFLTGILGDVFAFVINIFSEMFKFFMFILTLGYFSPSISFSGELIVSILTVLITFGLVGIIFKSLKLFDRVGMKIGYTILSSLISFFLTKLIWYFEKYIKFILIGLILLFLIIIICFAINCYKKRKNEKSLNN